MSDTLISVVAIFLAAVLMFIFPLMTTADRNDDISSQVVKTATTEFVDNVRSTGKITQDKYENFLQSISSTGNSFDVELEVQKLDTNSSKKTTQASSAKVGENQYYTEYSSQIKEVMNKNNGVYRLSEGDIFSAKIKNNNKTISQTLKNFFYRVTGNDTYSIAAQHSGIVNVNG